MSGGVEGGFLGVDVFFVLSGFLITSLLTQELKTDKSIDIKSFYIRRLARLTPALFLFLSIYMAFAPLMFPSQYGIAMHFRDTVLSGLYLSDYSEAFWQIPMFLGHTWSLAVEEHFYLLWPLLVLALGRTRRPELALLIAFAIAFAWKLACLAGQSYGQVYYRFDTRLTGLLLGALLSMRLQRSSLDSILMPHLSAYAAVTLLFLLAVTPFENKVAFAVGGATAEIATAILIGALVRGHAAPIIEKLLAHRMLVAIGKISYGIYLWHYPIALLVRGRMPFLAAFPVIFTASALLAAVSYLTVESFFRKPRFHAA
jgi:peptidoglycan/LPS O-acetylase OafA/YrhL